jgi:hypothetical protein
MRTSGMSQADSENRNAMTFPELVAWAWRETPPVHRNARNLAIHIVAVPLFVLGHGLLLGGVLASGWLVGAGILCIVVSIAVQGFGHSLEQQQVHSFTGPRDFLRRLYAEQFCNFWRFLFSGKWYSSFKGHNNGRVA